MKQLYKAPEMEICRFESEDVCTESGGDYIPETYDEDNFGVAGVQDSSRF